MITPPKRLIILVVDDEALVMAVGSFVLKQGGHSVDVVHDAESALSKIRTFPNRYDVIITDHSMPAASGLQLVEQLRKFNTRAKIVVLSASLSLEEEDAYRAFQVDKILYKPFSPYDLRREIEELAVG